MSFQRVVFPRWKEYRIKETPEFPAIRVLSMSKKQIFSMEGSFPHLPMMVEVLCLVSCLSRGD
jgi:hypothetical protein